MAYTLSIVIPVYNEQDNVAILHQEIRDAMEPLGISYEILFVDDGSSDSTVERLTDILDQTPTELRKTNPMRIIKFSSNFGQTAAMQAGFDYAAGKTIVTLDGDLQNDPRDIPKIMALIDEGYDIVCGWRKVRKDKALTRILPSKVANWLIGKVTGVPISDNGCSLKAYRTSVIKLVRLYSDMHRFIPAVASLYGARVTEVVVNHRPRIHGSTKYGLSRIWKVLLDLIVIQMLTHLQNRPVWWFTGVAFIYFLLAVTLATVSFGHYIEGGRQSIVFTCGSFLFFFLSSSLVCWGLLSEYFTTIKRHMNVKNKDHTDGVVY